MPEKRLPMRPRSHALEEESRRYVREVFPSSWTVVEPGQDYGTDLRVEVFEQDHPTGWVLEVQIKATDEPFPPASHYPLPVGVSWLNYALTRPNPVILVRYFAPERRALWLWVKDYVRLTLDVEKSTWDTQETVTLQLPVCREFGRGSLGEIRAYLGSGSIESLCENWRRLVDFADTSREHDFLGITPLPLEPSHLAHLQRVLPVEVRHRLSRAYTTVLGAHEQRPMPRDDIESVARDLPRLAMWTAQQRAKSTHCLSNLKQLSLAALMSAQDRGHLPQADSWCGELEPYVRANAVFSCPAAGDGGYAMNPAVAGQPVPDHSRLPLFFDAVTPGDPTRPAPEARHLLYANVAFTDGSCRHTPVEELPSLLPGR